MFKKLKPEQSQEIESLLEKYEPVGGIQAPDLVEIARDPESSLHNLFDWDDSRAAHKYRVDTARTVIESYRLSVQKTLKVGGEINVARVPGAVSTGNGYRSVKLVMSDPTSAQLQIETEWKRIDSLLSRLMGLCLVNGDEYEGLREWISNVRRDASGVLNSKLERTGT